MVRVTDYKFLDTGVKYFEYAGLSTDNKPTEMVATGSVFLEVDTGDVYLYDEDGAQWSKVGGSSE